MVDCGDMIYASYYSKHNKTPYGVNTVGKIKANFPIWKHHFEEYLPASKEVHILNIGCGDGNFVYWLQSLGYKNTQGIDLSEEQIAVGRILVINI